MDFWESKVLKSSIYRIMFCLPGIWENVKFIFFFALPAKIYHQIYIIVKQHTYVDFFPHIPYTPFFHLSFFIFPDSRFCKYIVLQALIPLIFIFPAHSQIFHRHILLCLLHLHIFPDFRSFFFGGDIGSAYIFFIAIYPCFPAVCIAPHFHSAKIKLDGLSAPIILSLCLLAWQAGANPADIMEVSK